MYFKLPPSRQQDNHNENSLAKKAILMYISFWKINSQKLIIFLLLFHK